MRRSRTRQEFALDLPTCSDWNGRARSGPAHSSRSTKISHLPDDTSSDTGQNLAFLVAPVLGNHKCDGLTDRLSSRVTEDALSTTIQLLMMPSRFLLTITSSLDSTMEACHRNCCSLSRSATSISLRHVISRLASSTRLSSNSCVRLSTITSPPSLRTPSWGQAERYAK